MNYHCEIKLQNKIENFDFFGVLHCLTAKCNLTTSSVMHSTKGFSLLYKKKPSKLKILKKKKT